MLIISVGSCASMNELADYDWSMMNWKISYLGEEESSNMNDTQWKMYKARVYSVDQGIQVFTLLAYFFY